MADNEFTMADFLRRCDGDFGLANAGMRPVILTKAVKHQKHESLLFLLCGRDYLHNPTDLKFQGIQDMMLGEGKPFQINIPGATLRKLAGILNPQPKVSTEVGTPHQFQAFAAHKTPGIRPGGVGNYNMCSQAIVEIYRGFGEPFFQGLILQLREPEPTALSSSAVFLIMQDMRNRMRRYWMGDLHQIGL
jgi:hypothetical protein